MDDCSIYMAFLSLHRLKHSQCLHIHSCAYATTGVQYGTVESTTLLATHSHVQSSFSWAWPHSSQVLASHLASTKATRVSVKYNLTSAETGNVSRVIPGSSCTCKLGGWFQLVSVEISLATESNSLKTCSVCSRDITALSQNLFFFCLMSSVVLSTVPYCTKS